jgi:hypothetical protein
MSNQFFKIPVDKLLQKLPKPVAFNQGQQAMIEGLNSKRFWVHIAGRRTGKSYAAALLAFAKLLEPGQQVMVVAPNFTLSSIIWDYVTDLIKQMNIEVEKFNQKDKVVKLINGSIFRLLSANNRDSLVGLQKMAAASSNTATKHILDGSLFLTLRIAENISKRVGDALQFPITANSLKNTIFFNSLLLGYSISPRSARIKLIPNSKASLQDINCSCALE